MPSYSLAGGIDASYAIAAGKTTVVINSASRVNYRAVYVGTGQMTMHWVQEGKTQVWRCDTKMLDPVEAQSVGRVGADGRWEMLVELESMFPAGLILQGRMVGTLMAPAVHVDIPMASDLWIFLVRSPWFPLKLQVDRDSLEVAHGSDRVAASIDVMPGGDVSAQLSMDGTGFKQGSLLVRRALGSYSSEELVGDVSSGSQVLAWKPITRVFDLVFVTKGNVSESQFAEVVRGLGAQVSSGVFGVGGVQGDFVLCDGPALAYSWVLSGHRGFLENEEDRTDARFAW